MAAIGYGRSPCHRFPALVPGLELRASLEAFDLAARLSRGGAFDLARPALRAMMNKSCGDAPARL